MEQAHKPRTHHELFQQDIWWLDNRGEWHELATMDRSHRGNLLPFLRKNVRHYHASAYTSLIASVLMQIHDPSDGVWMMQDEAAGEYELQTPEEWLESTPLVVKLRALEVEATRLDELRRQLNNRTFLARRRIQRWLRAR